MARRSAGLLCAAFCLLWAAAAERWPDLNADRSRPSLGGPTLSAAIGAEGSLRADERSAWHAVAESHRSAVL